MKLFGKIPVEIVFPLLVVWQLLLTFQGLDLADTGFQLSAYRFIFIDPYSVQYSMMFWLADVLGAFWMNINPAGGLHWFRMGWLIIISVTFLFYYYLLRPFVGKQKVLFGLAITLIFILQGGPECLNYDIFSTLGNALGIFTLFEGLSKNKTRLVLFSGFIFGIGVFFKLSNISSLAFILMIVFSVHQNKETSGQFLKKSFGWIAAYATGIILILSFIYLAGHLTLFLNNLVFISEMGKDANSTHGLIPMLRSYFSGYFNAIVLLVIFVSVSWVYFQFAERHLNLFSGKKRLTLLVLVSLGAIFLTFFFEDVFWSKVRYLFIGLMIFQGAALLFSRSISGKVRLLSLAGLILLFIAPLGSDSGLDKSVWGMWILGPLVFSMPDEFFKLKFLRLKVQPDQAIFVKRILIVLVLFTGLVFAWQKTYFDVGSRFSKTVAVDHPHLKYIYTSAKRAEVVNELVQEAFPKMKDEKYLLAFIEIPMVNYLSDKIPFISTSWPKLYYNPEKFRLKLDEALQHRKTFPAIIRQKQNTMLADWPEKSDPDYLNYPEDLSKWPEHGKILNEFIARNNYQLVWENEMFQLLLKK